MKNKNLLIDLLFELDFFEKDLNYEKFFYCTKEEIPKLKEELLVPKYPFKHGNYLAGIFHLLAEGIAEVENSNLITTISIRYFTTSSFNYYSENYGEISEDLKLLITIMMENRSFSSLIVLTAKKIPYSVYLQAQNNLMSSEKPISIFPLEILVHIDTEIFPTKYFIDCELCFLDKKEYSYFDIDSCPCRHKKSHLMSSFQYVEVYLAARINESSIQEKIIVRKRRSLSLEDKGGLLWFLGVSYFKKSIQKGNKLIPQIYLLDICPERKKFDLSKSSSQYSPLSSKKMMKIIFKRNLGLEKEKIFSLMSLFSKNDENLYFKTPFSVLLSGAPGTGKSFLLSSMRQIVSSDSYLSLENSTLPGIAGAIAVIKIGKKSYTYVEKGALLRANSNIFLLDEIDKRKEDIRETLLQMLDAQKISIIKAGIIYRKKLNLGTIAAGNRVLYEKRGYREKQAFFSELEQKFDISSTISRIDSNLQKYMFQQKPYVIPLKRKQQIIQEINNRQSLKLLFSRKLIDKVVEDYLELCLISSIKNSTNPLFIIHKRLRFAMAYARFENSPLVSLDYYLKAKENIHIPPSNLTN